MGYIKVLDSQSGSHFLNIILSLYNFRVSWCGKDWQKSEMEATCQDVRRSEICLTSVTKELDGLGQIILPLSTLVATSAKR